MAKKRKPVLKAFVLCNDIRQHTDKTRVDLFGAGLSVIRSVLTPPFPCKQSFWVYLLVNDEKEEGRARLAIMRADSGIRYFFPEISIKYQDPIIPAKKAIRVFNVVFPQKGVYFVELWYDGEWLLDNRLELEG